MITHAPHARTYAGGLKRTCQQYSLCPAGKNLQGHCSAVQVFRLKSRQSSYDELGLVEVCSCAHTTVLFTKHTLTKVTSSIRSRAPSHGETVVIMTCSVIARSLLVIAIAAGHDLHRLFHWCKVTCLLQTMCILAESCCNVCNQYRVLTACHEGMLPSDFVKSAQCWKTSAQPAAIYDI